MPNLNPLRIKIFPLITIPFLIEIVLAVGAVWLIYYRNGQNAVEGVVRQLHGEISDRIEQRINIYLANPHLINQLNADAYRLDQLDLEELDELERYFWNQLQAFREAETEEPSTVEDNTKSINSIYFGNEAGQLFGAEYDSDKQDTYVSRSDLNKGFITYPADSEGRPEWNNPNEQEEDDESYDPRIRPWYKAAEKSKKAWSEIYLDISSDSAAITASLAIRDDNDDLIGVLASDLLLSEIADFVNGLEVSDTGEVFIFDIDKETEVDKDTGGWELVVSTSEKQENLYPTVVIEPRYENEKPKIKLDRPLAIDSENPIIKEAARHLKKQSNGEANEIDFQKISTFESGGEKYFLKVTPISDDYELNWYMAVIVPESDFMSQIDKDNKKALLFALATLIAATVVSLYTSDKISKPIRELTNYAKELKESSSKDEAKISKFRNPYEIAALATTLKEAFENLEKTNAAYARFVPKEFLEKLSTKIITDVKLGDSFKSENKMTILFSDIRGFTSLSDSMTPEEIFRFINSYFGVMAPQIRQHNGFIDKYIGDAIMALFDGNQNADNAVQAGIEMQRALDSWNIDGRDNNRYNSVKTGIGIHTGELILGTVGTNARMDSTVTGQEVNRASRLEGLTKDYGARILISDQTLEALVDRTRYLYRFLGGAKVKGVSDLLKVYEILDGDSQGEQKIKSKERFEAGVKLFDKAYECQTIGSSEEARNFYSQSKQAFEEAREIYSEDVATNFFIDRCERRLA